MKNTIYLVIFFISIHFSCSSCGTNPADPIGQEEQAAKGLKIKVMTYNIHHANPPASEGIINLDAIAEIIRESGAELVALQELDSVTERSGKIFQLKYLAQKLNMQFHYFRTIPYQGGAYGVGVLSKFPISSPQTITLPKDNSINSENRVLGMVKVQLPNTKTIYFVSTHWDVVSENNRILQAEKTSEVALKLEYPVILGGDLNTKRETESMNILRNVFTEASVKFEPTIPENNPNRKIDHILYAKDGNFKLVDEEVLYNAKTRKASDHLPYVVDLIMVE